MAYGLGGIEKMTLEEIGRSLDPPVTKERVRQLRDQAIRKLRRMAKA
jgi:DNA-directed RNA polymerase sigma subunit (sigma70/sigma32)